MNFDYVLRVKWLVFIVLTAIWTSSQSSWESLLMFTWGDLKVALTFQFWNYWLCYSSIPSNRYGTGEILDSSYYGFWKIMKILKIEVKLFQDYRGIVAHTGFMETSDLVAGLECMENAFWWLRSRTNVKWESTGWYKPFGKFGPVADHELRKVGIQW